MQKEDVLFCLNEEVYSSHLASVSTKAKKGWISFFEYF